ncbi:hypothetical protein AOLI_G00087360 [Acnodon oligacanthus]
MSKQKKDQGHEVPPDYSSSAGFSLVQSRCDLQLALPLRIRTSIFMGRVWRHMYPQYSYYYPPYLQAKSMWLWCCDEVCSVLGFVLLRAVALNSNAITQSLCQLAS